MKKLKFKTLILKIALVICIGVFLSFEVTTAEGDDASTNSWYWYLGQKVQEKGTSSVTEDDVIEIAVHKFPEPAITEVDGYHHVEMEELNSIANPGEPVLPVKNINVLIPQGKNIKDSEVILGEKVTLPGEYIVEPGQEPLPLSYEGYVDKSLPNDEIYNSSVPFPLERKELVTIQNMCGYRIAIFNLHPMEYTPSSGELSYYKSLSLRVNLEPEEDVKSEEGVDESGDVSIMRPKLRNLPSDKKRLKEFIDNPQDISGYDTLTEGGSIQPLGVEDIGGTQPSGGSSGGGAGKSFVNPAESYGYVVITNEWLKDAPDSYNFQALCAEKEARGITTKIVTTEWIYANYDGRRPDGKIDNATKIRNFIIDAYNNWETEYILLGGDATGNSSYGEIIPARDLFDEPWSGSEYATTIPSDLYYSCLEGSMDSNANGIYGEPNDGRDRGVYDSEIDLGAEICIGRAPVAARKELSNFVRKTLEYKNTRSDYLFNTYQVGEFLSADGTMNFAKSYLEEVRRGSSAHGFTTTGFASIPSLKLNTLYDADYWYNYFSEWSPDELIDIINYEGVHIINHLGHSWIDKNMKLLTYDVNVFTNTDYFFGYSQGCWPGAFDRDCIVEHFVKEEHGAFAFVANSRYGWGNKYSTAGASQYYAREFWDAVFGEDRYGIGDANLDSKHDNLWSKNFACHRWCYLELNLFGDPELEFRFDTSGGVSHESSVLLDKDTYTSASQVAMSVIDSDLGSSAVVNVVSRTETIPEEITLERIDPGVFEGSIQLQLGTSISGDGILQVCNDDEIIITYYDESAGKIKEATAEVDIAIAVTSPNANFTASTTNGIAPLTVNFTDSSTGTINSWLWNFGDGTASTEQNPSHSYNTCGTYTASLRVTGPGGSDTEKKEDFINVTYPVPIAVFTGSPRNGTMPLDVSFTNTSTGSITSYLWNFGDGTTSMQQSPSHAYYSPGTYNVSLKVTGPGGSHTEEKTNYIEVSCPLPVASFTASPRNGKAPHTVSFTDTSAGTVDSRLWNFGDGTASTEQNPSHTYNTCGTYTASLRVTGPGGSDTGTKSNYIIVSNPTPPVSSVDPVIPDEPEVDIDETEAEDSHVVESPYEPTDKVVTPGYVEIPPPPNPPPHTPKTSAKDSAVTEPDRSNIEEEEGYVEVVPPRTEADLITNEADFTADIMIDETEGNSTSVGIVEQSPVENNGPKMDLGDIVTKVQKSRLYHLYKVYSILGIYNGQLAATGTIEEEEETEPVYVLAENVETITDAEPLTISESEAIKQSDTFVIITYEFPEPAITEVDGYHRIEMAGAPSIANPGEPVLPVKGAEVLIPAGKKIKDSEVILGEKVTLPGTYIIEPGQEPLPLRGETEKTLPKEDIYESSNPFPPQINKLVTIQKTRDYKIAIFNLYPVEYTPLYKELSYYKSISLKVDFIVDEGESGFEDSYNTEATADSN